MYNIIDYFYSPILWIIINIGILMSIIFVVRTTNRVKKQQRVTILERYFDELVEALNNMVDADQKKVVSHYANSIIKYITSIGLAQIRQGQTFREFIESLKIYKFVKENDLEALIELYEYARFSNENLDYKRIEELRSIMLRVGKAAKKYVETEYHAGLLRPS